MCIQRLDLCHSFAYIGTLQYSQYPHTEPLAYSTFSGSAFSFSSLDSVALAIVIKMHKPRNNNCPVCILIISAPLLVNSKTASKIQSVVVWRVPRASFSGYWISGIKEKITSGSLYVYIQSSKNFYYYPRYVIKKDFLKKLLFLLFQEYLTF